MNEYVNGTFVDVRKMLMLMCMHGDDEWYCVVTGSHSVHERADAIG